jgi:predicted RecB family nuclease
MRQHDDGGYLLSPTDLVNFLSCHHAIVLDLRSFTQDLAPDEVSESGELLRKKGLEHEKAYLQTLKDQGKTVTQIPQNLPPADAVRLTSAALRSGVAVIYQAALFDGCWGGYADFLIRTSQPSALGDFSYEATDTKLARHPEARHRVQLSVYDAIVE